MYLLQMGHAKVKDFRISAASGAKVLRGAACELFAPAADEDVWYIRHGCAVLSYFRNSALAVCCRGVAAWDEVLLATRLRSRGASKAGAEASAAAGATYDEGVAALVAARGTAGQLWQRAMPPLWQQWMRSRTRMRTWSQLVRMMMSCSAL